MNKAVLICSMLVVAVCCVSWADWSDGTIVDGDAFTYKPPTTSYQIERDPEFTNWLSDASALTLKLGGSTNVLTDDGTNLLRNGVLIAGSGSGSGFPATNDMNAAGHNMTNAGTVQASAFQGGTFNGTTISGTTFSGQNMTLSGNLTVNSNVTYNTVINKSTTVYLGTNYVTNTSVTHVYSTNYVYLYVYTNELNYVTNYTEYQTYVNVGGYFDAGLASWVRLPFLTMSNGTAIATGAWDFVGATVTGITAGTGSGFPLATNGDLAGFSLTNGGTITVTNNIHIGPDGMTNLARFTVAGNGITNQNPDHYTMTDQQRSSTAAIQGDNSAYFYAEGVNSDVETAFGAALATQGFAGTISAHDFNLRVGNTNKFGVTATGINGHGQTFSNVVLDSGVELDPTFTAVSNAWWEEIQKGASAGAGNLSATNAPTGSGQTLYSSDNTLSNLYFSESQLISSLSGHTGDFYVAKWGSDTNSGTSWTSPKLTIQSAADSCTSNSLVVVAAGVYVEDVSLASGVYARVINPDNGAKLVSASGSYALTGSRDVPTWTIQLGQIDGGVFCVNLTDTRIQSPGTTDIFRCNIARCAIVGNSNLSIRSSEIVASDIIHNKGSTLINAVTSNGVTRIAACNITSNSARFLAWSGSGITTPVRFYNCRIAGNYMYPGGAGENNYACYFYGCDIVGNVSSGHMFAFSLITACNLEYNGQIRPTGNLAYAGSITDSRLLGNTSVGPFVAGTINLTRVMLSDASNGCYNVGSQKLDGDLTQRATDRHYFGANYLGYTNGAFLFNTNLTVQAPVTATEFIIGYVPIQSDGTNYFVSPFGTNLYFQLSTNAPVY